MKAYVVEHPGGAFTEIDLPRPAPGAGQVLVRVHAGGVNPLDTKIHSGQLPNFFAVRAFLPATYSVLCP